MPLSPVGVVNFDCRGLSRGLSDFDNRPGRPYNLPLSGDVNLALVSPPGSRLALSVWVEWSHNR